MKKSTWIAAIIVIFIAGSVFAASFFIPPTKNIPINTHPKQTTPVSLYYYHPELDEDEAGNLLCSSQGLVAVQREISMSTDIEEKVLETVELLVQGALTTQERSQGITTEFPLEGFEVEHVDVHQGKATITFADPRNQTIGGSCRVGILWHQINATVTQFPEVQEFHFLPEDLFQP